MPHAARKVTIYPPPGRPSWGATGNLPLLYLGWGERDFAKNPLPAHYDRGTSYYVVVCGEVILTAGDERQTIQGPTALLIDSDCFFGISQIRKQKVHILVWVWEDKPFLRNLQPAAGNYLAFNLRSSSVSSLEELHMRCRKEVAASDDCLRATLPALRHLVEAEILRASLPVIPAGDTRWELAHSWMMNNLSIHTPVPALCDYLGMSPSALHRFFRRQTGVAPGAYFRRLKWKEAKRLIEDEGRQVKAVAYQLGYSHPNDLSRAINRDRAFSPPDLGSTRWKDS